MSYISCYSAYFTTLMLLVSGWFKAIQAFVCMSVVLSIGALLLAFVYTFIHSVSKGMVLQLIIVAAALAGNTVHSSVQLENTDIYVGSVFASKSVVIRFENNSNVRSPFLHDDVNNSSVFIARAIW